MGPIVAIDFNKVLPKETAELYKIKGLEKNQSTRIVFDKIGLVDFATLKVEDAKNLIKKGATFIVEKPAKHEGSDKKSK